MTFGDEVLVLERLRLRLVTLVKAGGVRSATIGLAER
jgi:hypothetical protein